MVKRFLGGLISATPQVVSPSGTGFYSLATVMQAKQSGNWAGPPPAPTSVSAVAGNTQAVVSFTAPANDGGAAITSYTVTSSPGNITVTGSSSPITVTGLTNNTSYTFTVKATNTFGTGNPSTSSSSVTPFAPIFDYLVVAGGGGGATVAYYSPGGGAGGLLSSTGVTYTPGTQYTITVGAGGTAASDGFNGSDSTITGTGFTTVRAYGGGAGMNYGATAHNGGSGGGGGHASQAGGKGVYPGSTYISEPRQGYDGGTGYNSSSASAGAGGGAGGAGADGVVNNNGATGGIGLQSSITGTSVYYAGGGGGGVEAYSTYNGGAGGSGGGGKGVGKDGIPTAGTQNTGGGGGGGAGASNLNSGGSGVVIIRTLATASATSGSPTITTDGSYKVYKFTSSGTITF